jgi:dipeptidyl aminopeptidase/acylaminoacyl peptidase
MSEDFRHAQRASVGLTAYNADTPPQWRHWWEAISPSLNVDRLRAPLLMELGETEALQAMQLYSELRDRGRPVEAFVYPGAGHIKWRPNQILASRERAMAWIDFWLKDELRADPSDPDRAARWTVLRSELARDRAQP